MGERSESLAPRLAWPFAVGALAPALLPGVLACALAFYAHRTEGRRKRVAAVWSLIIGATNLAGTLAAIWFVEAMLGVVLYLTVPCLAAGIMLEHRRRLGVYEDEGTGDSEVPVTSW